jgi:hypothetical protein
MPTKNSQSEPKGSPTLRDRAGDYYDDARERAVEAYDRTRSAARRAGQSAGDQFSEAPLLALGGGLALGALVAALLPTSRRERELLGPVTDRIKEQATSALDAAREAGSARLEELGLTRQAGEDALRTIVGNAGEAAKASAQAAVSSIRGE